MAETRDYAAVHAVGLSLARLSLLSLACLLLLHSWPACERDAACACLRSWSPDAGCDRWWSPAVCTVKFDAVKFGHLVSPRHEMLGAWYLCVARRCNMQDYTIMSRN